MVPWVGESMVPTMFRKVVLPPPDGPLIITNSPLRTAWNLLSSPRLTEFSAGTLSPFSSTYSLHRLSHSTMLGASAGSELPLTRMFTGHPSTLSDFLP